VKAGTPTVHALEQRWERIGLGVRCAYNPQRPEVLQHYVQAGRRLSSLNPAQEARVQRRMLELLLHTAADVALPWHWRAACLEHTAWPLARLTRLLGGPAGAGEHALDRHVQQAWDLLGMPPKSAIATSGVERPEPHADR
jgi:hypothetical protein